MRSAKQAAMANAGLASGTQIRNTRGRQTNLRVPSRSQIQQPQREPSGSEARLGDILVSILERLSSLETRINTRHHNHIFQAIDGLEERFACLERGNNECLAHIMRELGALRTAYAGVHHRMQEVNCPRTRCATTSPRDVVSPVQIRPRSAQSCVAEVSVGEDREFRAYSPSSVGTNELGYDGEFDSDMASPTPSERMDIDSNEIDEENLAQLEEAQVDPEVQVQSSDDQKEGQSASREVTIEISDMAEV